MALIRYDHHRHRNDQADRELDRSPHDHQDEKGKAKGDILSSASNPPRIGRYKQSGAKDVLILSFVGQAGMSNYFPNLHSRKQLTQGSLIAVVSTCAQPRLLLQLPCGTWKYNVINGHISKQASGAFPWCIYRRLFCWVLQHGEVTNWDSFLSVSVVEATILSCLLR